MSTPPIVIPPDLPLPLDVRAALARRLAEGRFASERPEIEGWVRRAAAGDDAALEELKDAFSGPLPIGTGGRRGTCGVGPNRMNVALMRETAQGLADAILEEGLPRHVAIVYDTRRESRAFAMAIAEQLARNAIRALVIDAPRPTPLLSFTVRRLGCGAGVVVSASHNPPSDNGIKIYGPDGAQLLGARDRALMAAIEAAAATSWPEGPVDPAFVDIRASHEELAEIDAPYIEDVLAQGMTHGDLGLSGLEVVYSPFHGVGHTVVLPVLARRGLSPRVIEAQLPDAGRFATLPSANPEQPESFALAIDQAGTADLLLANDPDADRLGVMARDGGGKLRFIDGNRLGVLLLDHILRHGPVPPDGWVLSTIVTTPLVATMARAHGIDVVDDLLVGFKHHAGMIGEAPDRPCILATEESHGYLRGQNVRDKDGISAALLLCEAAADARAQGGLLRRLDELWTKYGYYREQTSSLYARGVAGREAIASLMAAWRRDPPSSFAGAPVASFTDRLRPRHTGSPTRDLPGNALIFELAPWDGMAGRVVVRPSGTEPKAKVYALIRGLPGSGLALAESQARVDAWTREVLEDATERAESAMASLMDV